MRRTAPVVLTLSLCLSLGAGAADDASKYNDTSRTNDAPKPKATYESRDPKYVVKPLDSMVVKVLDLDEVNGTVVVDPQGDISLQVVGRLHAAGLELGQVEANLKEALKEYLRDPKLTLGINVTESEETARERESEVTVLGQMVGPGVRRFNGKKYLMDVLAESGGQKPDASDIAEISRRVEQGPLPLPGLSVDPSKTYYIARINLKTLNTPSGLPYNIEIKSGDVIMVPRADVVYVMGAVKKPGGYTFPTKRTSSVLQLLTLAEGFDKFASPSKAYVMRLKPGLDRQEARVDVSMILKGKIPDVILEPNDVLVVPSSTLKSVMSTYPATLTQLLTSMAVYAVKP